MKTYGTPTASVQVDDSGLIRALDRVSAGAAGTFVQKAHETIVEVRTGAIPRWPVRSGESKRSFSEMREITESQITMALANLARSGWGPYAYRIRWSVRTSDSLREEANDWAASTWQKLEWYTRRGTHGSARARIANHVLRRKLGGKDITGGDLLGWGHRFGPQLTGEPSQEKLRRHWAATLRWRHGAGAPSAAEAGKQPWVLYVRKPGAKKGAELAAKLQNELMRLARREHGAG